MNQSILPGTEGEKVFDAAIAKVNNTVDSKNVLFPGCKVKVDMKSIAKHQAYTIAVDLHGVDLFFAGGYYNITNPNHPKYFAMLVDAKLSYWFCVPLCAVTRMLSWAIPLDSLSAMASFLSNALSRYSKFFACSSRNYRR